MFENRLVFISIIYFISSHFKQRNKLLQICKFFGTLKKVFVKQMEKEWRRGNGEMEKKCNSSHISISKYRRNVCFFSIKMSNIYECPYL